MTTSSKKRAKICVVLSVNARIGISLESTRPHEDFTSRACSLRFCPYHLTISDCVFDFAAVVSCCVLGHRVLYFRSTAVVSHCVLSPGVLDFGSSTVVSRCLWCPRFRLQCGCVPLLLLQVIRLCARFFWSSFSNRMKSYLEASLPKIGMPNEPRREADKVPS